MSNLEEVVKVEIMPHQEQEARNLLTNLNAASISTEPSTSEDRVILSIQGLTRNQVGTFLTRFGISNRLHW